MGTGMDIEASEEVAILGQTCGSTGQAQQQVQHSIGPHVGPPLAGQVAEEKPPDLPAQDLLMGITEVVDVFLGHGTVLQQGTEGVMPAQAEGGAQ